MRSLLFALCFLSCLLGLIESLSLPVKDTASRRDFIDSLSRTSAAAIAATTIPATLLTNEASNAADVEPFCVIGANGKTGTKCVQELLDRKYPVRATSRSGIYASETEIQNSQYLTPMQCDVTLPNTIDKAVKGSRAVIFAASASKTGGTPAQVDNEGLVNVAKACIAAKVPHLVIVSSGSVTKPESAVFKFLNLFGKNISIVCSSVIYQKNGIDLLGYF